MILHKPQGKIISDTVQCNYLCNNRIVPTKIMQNTKDTFGKQVYSDVTVHFLLLLMRLI